MWRLKFNDPSYNGSNKDDCTTRATDKYNILVKMTPSFLIFDFCCARVNQLDNDDEACIV